MNHSFDIEHAAAYGLVEAILISNFQFWIAKNKANEQGQRDGRTWTFNSVRALNELFPYLTPDKISGALNRLVAQGVLVDGVFNKRPADRTKWYAFANEDDFLPMYSHLGKSKMKVGKIQNGLPENPKCLIKNDVNKDVEPSSEKPKKASRIKSSWKLPKNFGDWAIEKYPTWTVEFVRERGDKFRDHWSAISGSAGLKTDWLATWRNFCLGEAEFIARTTHTPSSGGASAPRWSSDATVIADAALNGITPRPGESIYALKDRLNKLLDPRGPVVDAMSPVTPQHPSTGMKTAISAELAAERSAMLKGALSMMKSKVLINE